MALLEKYEKSALFRKPFTEFPNTLFKCLLLVVNSLLSRRAVGPTVGGSLQRDKTLSVEIGYNHWAGEGWAAPLTGLHQGFSECRDWWIFRWLFGAKGDLRLELGGAANQKTGRV
jgi:hypothetical protein